MSTGHSTGAPPNRLMWFLALGYVAVVVTATVTVLVPELREPEPDSPRQNVPSSDGNTQ